MKRIFILFGVLALAVGVNAQSNQHSNYIGLNINGGFNTMRFNPAMGDAKLGFGFGGGLRYTHFFGTHFGVGLGVQFNHAGASALYDSTEVTRGLTHEDNPGVTYDLYTTFDGWRERQTLNYLSVPVELYWRAPVSERSFFLIGLGAQLDLPFGGKYKVSDGAFRTEGYFPSLGYTISDMPDHGFRTYDEEQKGDISINKMGVSVIADLGFNLGLSDNWGFYIGIYGTYGFTNLLDSTSTQPMLKINEDDASKLDYNGTFASEQIDALSLLNFGVKLGLNLGWDCEHKDRASKADDEEPALTPYDNTDDQQRQDALDKAKKESAAIDKQKKETLRDAKDAADLKAADEERARQEALENAKQAADDKAAQEAADAAADEAARQAALEHAKKAADDKAAQEAAAAAAEEAARQAALENAKKAADDKAAQEAADAAAEEAARQAALERAKNAAANNAYGNNYDEESPEEAAAREARCNARRMNNPDLAQAMSSIDADLDEVEQAAQASGSAEAKAAVADARAKAADAKAAHKNGKYCRAYDMMNDAYASIADAYAACADTYAGQSNSDDAKKAADDAALYAEAAHKDGLDCAMAASRNARINSEIARDQDAGGKKSAAWNDPNYADYLAKEAMAMAEESGSKAAKTDAKDASGKAYRGNLADSYAASAKSFASSALAYAGKSNNPEARAAAEEAQRYAGEAAEAARMGDTAAAYRAALAAKQAAERARRPGSTDNGNANSTPSNDNANGKPADRAQLQQYLDEINATVHFDFSSTEPKFDNKTDMTIRALCLAMKADNSVKVLITGHTDNIGSAESNMSYGKRRAEALKDLMVQKGAPAANISTASKGQNEPVVANDTDEHRYQNRRAVITLK